MPWSTLFDEPIPLRGGARLTTLQHAADYVMQLPKDVQQQLSLTRSMVAGLEKVTERLACAALKSWESGYD